MKKPILERYRRNNSGKLVIKGVMAEGLVIAAWVSVWEGVAALLLKVRRIYRQLANSGYSFGSNKNP